MEEKSVALLNTLVEINSDRLLGYQTAFDDTQDADLKNLFAEFSLTSKDCKKELEAEITKMGGTPTADTHASGNLHRAWIDLKVAITGNSRSTILSSCEFGENTAIDTYDKALSDSSSGLTGAQQTMIINQQKRIQSNLDRVKGLMKVMA